MHAIGQDLPRQLRIRDEHTLQSADDRRIEVHDRRVILAGKRLHRARRTSA